MLQSSTEKRKKLNFLKKVPATQSLDPILSPIPMTNQQEEEKHEQPEEVTLVLETPMKRISELYPEKPGAVSAPPPVEAVKESRRSSERLFDIVIPEKRKRLSNSKSDPDSKPPDDTNTATNVSIDEDNHVINN